jgi:glycosyltransferase involved in cell wall biosynthesis
MVTGPKVTVLMATHNGALYLEEQIVSLLRQTHSNFDLYVSDDGSQDGTWAILQKYQKQFPDKIFISQHEFHSASKNFFHLISMSAQWGHQSDYWAFCDQDDCWLEDKLERAITCLEEKNGEDDPRDPSKSPKSFKIPKLYGGPSLLMDHQGQLFGTSTPYKKKPSFQNALVQSFAGGNTLVLNQRAMDLVRIYSHENVSCHYDWWIYLVISAFRGELIYDSIPKIKYRQHLHNFLGDHSNWKGRIKRFSLFLKGDYKKWNQHHCQELMKHVSQLDHHHQEILQGFSKLTQGELNVFERIHYLYFSRTFPYRRDFFGQMTLCFGTLINQV